jgi:hypothetical protein
MFLSSNSFYVLCLFREVVKPLFLIVNVVLLAHLLPLYFFYHRLPLPNSVSVIHCIVQIIARPSLSLGQDAACDKFYNRLPHPLSSINTSLAVAKLLISPQIQTTGVKGSGYQVHRIPLLLPLFLARPAGAGPRQLSAHALALSPAAPRNARARPCSLTRGTTAIPGQPAQAPARPGPPPPHAARFAAQRRGVAADLGPCGAARRPWRRASSGAVSPPPVLDQRRGGVAC